MHDRDARESLSDAPRDHGFDRLGQVSRLRKERGCGRYSLWTGDLGVVFYAADCLDRVGTYPVFDLRS